MKIITLEEHFQIPAIKKALAKLLPDTQGTSPLASYGPLSAQLEDLGDGRLKAMDTMGVDVQILSYSSSRTTGYPHRRGSTTGKGNQ